MIAAVHDVDDRWPIETGDDAAYSLERVARDVGHHIALAARSQDTSQRADEFFERLRLPRIGTHRCRSHEPATRFEHGRQLQQAVHTYGVSGRDEFHKHVCDPDVWRDLRCPRYRNHLDLQPAAVEELLGDA